MTRAPGHAIYDGIGGISACPYQRFENAHNLTGRGLLHYNSTRY